MTRDDAARLDLLLADADEKGAVLVEGLTREALGKGLKPATGPRDAPRLEGPDASPNDLPAQRWGLVAPEGPLGDRLLDAIAPLVKLREREQGARARVYRVGPDLDASAAARFRDDVHRARSVPEHERPQYLLVLGDLHQVSLAFQQTLTTSAYVGRVHVAKPSGEADLDGVRAYAEKVVAWAQISAPDVSGGPEMLFYTARDGSVATRTGYTHLTKPCVEMADKWRAHGAFSASAVVEVDEADALMEVAARDARAVLLSVTHGLGAPKHTRWPSVEQQRARQGALLLDLGAVLSAEEIRRAPFLPGGMWFCVACFGAGTPSASAYYPWLSLLAQEGAYAAPVQAVLRSLPGPKEQPFVAAMPQAALAHPEGPLGIIGHVDLAWTYGFLDAHDLSVSRSTRVLSALKVLVNGSRAGVALDALMRFYRETNDELLAGYEAEEDAALQKLKNPVAMAERGNLWMLRNDLRGYVLLGDPAARLSVGA